MEETEYFGCDLTEDVYNTIAIERIDPKYFDLEPELFNTKWFDYRFINPTQATYCYAHHYKIALKRAMVRRTDIHRGEAWNVFPGIKDRLPLFDKHGEPAYWSRDCKGGKRGDRKMGTYYPDDVFDCKDRYVTAIWRGRQCADQLGIPYPTYCAGAVRYHEKMLWKNLPLPSAMYSNAVKLDKNGDPIKTMVEGIAEYWAETSNNRVMVSDISQYKVENFDKHPYQFEHIKHALNQLALSNNKVAVLSDLIHQRRVLKPEWVSAIPTLDGQNLANLATRFYLDTNPEGATL